MRVIIAGNGLAGTIAAKTLREISKEIEIDIYAEEKHRYYPRPNLIEFLAGNLPQEKIFAFPEGWYLEQKINLHLARPVRKIFPDTQEIELEEGRKEKYDALLLATGSRAFLPLLKGVERVGVFTLRTLDDALAILESLKDSRRVVIIGGGILGLEVARAINFRGYEVEVVEFFNRLLPRQLDSRGASLLKEQIENLGIKVHLELATEEIVGEERVKAVRFKNGGELEAQVVIFASGIRSELRLAKEGGLNINKGIIVDDFLTTSNPKIFAAGDNIEHRGKSYGIIPASFSQARVAALNIAGEKKAYEGTIPSNTLKIAGLYVTSVGVVTPEGNSYEELVREEQDKGIYKKIVLQDGEAVGAIWMGTKKGVDEIVRLVTQRKNLGKWKDSLFEEDFDFSVL